MNSLRSFQEGLKKLLFVQGHAPTASHLWPGGIPPRLGVYRNTIHGNWFDVLDHDFPLTKKQFTAEAWTALRDRYFTKYPPQHWELNTSVAPFVNYLATQKVAPYIKELADYEWHDLMVFIDRSPLQTLSGVTNPTAAIRLYQHQIFDWVSAEAPSETPPLQKPEVLVFHRDRQNTIHIQEADPLMLLVLDHFRKPGAALNDLEPIRQKLLPKNTVALSTVLKSLRETDLVL